MTGPGKRRSPRRLPELEQIVAFRRVIEAGAARLAAERADAADLAALDATTSELRTAESPAAFRRADARFHLLLARVAANPPLERAIVDARERMVGVTNALSFTLMVSRTAEEHSRVLHAVGHH